MADEFDVISEYIDRDGVRGDTAFMLSQFQSITDELKKLKAIKIDLKGVTTSKETVNLIKAQTEALKQLEVQTRTTNKTLLDQEKINTQKAKTDREVEKNTQEQLKTDKLREQQSQRNAAAAVNEQKIIDEIANEYRQLGKALKDAEDRYKTLYIQKGKDATVTQDALKTALSYRKILDDIDQSLGNYQRNVGNYSSATRGLRIEVGQLLRETPNLGNPQSFLLAISNNLPLFFEAVDKVKQENAELAAQGQKTKSVFAQIGAAILSPINLLTVGVAVLTVFGDKILKFVEGLFDGTKAIEDLKEKIALFNKELDESNKRLDFWLRYLDRLNQAPRVQLQIDNTNVPKIQQMRNELKELGDESVRLQDKFKTTEEEFQRQTELQGKAYSQFVTFASKTAQEAFSNGTIEGIMDKLNEQDKALYSQLKTATDAFAKINEQYSDARTELDVDNLNRRLKQIEIDKELADQERKILRDNAVYAAEITRAKNDTILSSEKSSFSERLSALRSNYAEEKRIIEANLRSVLSDPTKSRDEINAAKKTAELERVKNELDYSGKVREIQKEEALRRAEAEKQIFIQQKEFLAKQYQEINQFADLSLRDRLQLEENYAAAQRAIADKEFEYAKKQDSYKFLTQEEKLAKQIDYENKVLQITIDANKRASEIVKAELDRQDRYREEDVDRVKRIYSGQSVGLSDSYAEEVIALNNLFKKGLLSREAYEARRKQIDVKAKKDALINVIDETTEILKRYDNVGNILEQKEVRLAALRLKLGNTKGVSERQDLINQIAVAEEDVKITRNAVDKKIQLEKGLSNAKRELSDADIEYEARYLQKLSDLYRQLASEINESVFSILESSIDRRKNALQDEMDLLDARKAKEIELVNNSVASEQDKAARISIINARAQSQREALERRQRELDQQKARYEKQKAITDIVTNTALAIIKTLAEFPGPKGITLSYIIGAIGAAQLARTIAQPIPRYKEGTMNHPGGKAVVGDGGKSEMVVTPDGSISKTPATDTVLDLPKGTIVYPDYEAALRKLPMDQTNKVINFSQTKTEAIHFQAMTKTLGKKLDGLGSIIKNKKESHFKIEGPVKSYIRQGESWQEYLGRNL